MRAAASALLLLLCTPTLSCRSGDASSGSADGTLLGALQQSASHTGDGAPVAPTADGTYLAEVEGLYASLGTAQQDDKHPPGEIEPEADLADLLSSVPEPAPQESAPNPFEEFGERIIWYRESGFVMKAFSFPLGVGARVQSLIEGHSNLNIHASLVDEGEAGPQEAQPADSIVLHLLTAQDAEAFSPPRSPGLQPPTPVSLSDWLIVVAQPAQLRRVQRFIQVFVADVKQIQIEAKIVEISTTKTLDYGIRPIEEGTPIFGLPNPGSLLHTIDFSFGNTVDAAEALFGVSAVFDGVAFNALLEMVATDESASIVSQPKVAVREGARAELVEIERVPIMQLSAINSNGNFTSNVTFKEVGVQMYVVPRVVGSDSVILNVDAEVSQITGTAVTFVLTDLEGSTSTIGIPEISRRKVATTVRLEPGQGLVMGGLISERTLQRERKVPILGDIPVLGMLFKNHFQVVERTDVLFFIYPRILQGMDLNPDF